MTRFDEAVIFAVKAHSGQKRKFHPIPYILHPMEVANIAATITEDEDVMIACLLHDTIEDCGVEKEEIEAAFGERVAFLVDNETETHQEANSDGNWLRRKEESLKGLLDSDDPGVKAVWLSDKLSNLRSFYRDFLVDGDRIWERTHEKDPAKQAWYYETAARGFEELKDTLAYNEYIRLIDIVFHGKGQSWN